MVLAPKKAIDSKADQATKGCSIQGTTENEFLNDCRYLAGSFEVDFTCNMDFSLKRALGRVRNTSARYNCAKLGELSRSCFFLIILESGMKEQF